MEQWKCSGIALSFALRLSALINFTNCCAPNSLKVGGKFTALRSTNRISTKSLSTNVVSRNLFDLLL